MKEIIGEYVKQQWTGRKQDHAAETGREKFEATDYVLCTLKYEDVIELQDHSECTDAIGNAHVTHDGPHEVYITDAICEYFNVNSLDEITQAAFLSAHQDYMSRPLRPFTVQISRTSSLLRTVELNARSASAAKDRALEMAGKFDYEKSAYYEVENVTPLPFDELSAKSTEQLIAELIAMRAKILMNDAYSSTAFECEIKRLLKDHVPYSSLTREALEDEWKTAQAGVQEFKNCKAMADQQNMKTPKRKTRKPPRQRVDSLTSGDRFELLKTTAGCDPGEYIYEGITAEAKSWGRDLVEILDNGLSMVIRGDTLVRKLLIVMRSSS